MNVTGSILATALLLANLAAGPASAQTAPADSRITVSINGGRPEVVVAKPLGRMNTRLSTRIRTRIESRLDASTRRGFSATTSLDEANDRSRQSVKP